MPELVERHEEPQHFVTQKSWEKFIAELRARGDFSWVLQTDFIEGIQLVCQLDFPPVESRALVRAFGSLVDGLSRVMQEIAVSTAELFGGRLNPFLQQKYAERTTSTYQRIYTSYRLVAEFLPKCPLARLPDSRWNDLHRAIEIRNRVVHPVRLADTVVSADDCELVIEVGNALLRDFAQFMEWFKQKEQKLVWEHTIERRRLFPKVGRNEKCPCGSYRKYKSCCAIAQYAA